MLRILTEFFLCSLPMIFIFLILYQISNWKINSFHWGVIVFESSDSFPSKIPEHLLNKVIHYKGLTFSFISPKVALFQARTGRQGLHNDDSGSMVQIFPLLGEIVLDKAGIAKVVLRIPYSVISLFLCATISVSGFIILSKETNIDLVGIATSLSLLSGFVFFLYSIEKINLQTGPKRIKEYILKNSK